MATLKPVIFKAKALKDGSHEIRIAVSHKQVTSYIVTRFIVQENQFKNGQVVKRPDAAVINRKLRKQLDEYQDRLDAIEHQNLYTSAQLKKLISEGVAGEQPMFGKVVDDFVDELVTQKRSSYAVSIERVGRYFMEYTRGDIILADITPLMIENFESCLRKRKVSEATVSTLMAQLKAIINRAVKKQLVSYDVHPFVSTKILSSPVRKLDLLLSNFNRIRLSEPQYRRQRIARDLFMLSFYLGGANLIDIMEMDFREKKVEYSRSKTAGRTVQESRIVITVPDAAEAIVNRWMKKGTGKLDFGYKYTYHNFSQYVNYCLQALAKEVGVDERITFYSARKSFAQFASELGIPDSVIDYCLGHSDKTKGVIRYYTQVRQKQADIAIGRVVDYVNHPEMYKEYIELRSDIMMMK